ncbi:MAG: hypothetical protein ABUT39_15555 [Acidobacteriota bacterium]
MAKSNDVKDVATNATILEIDDEPEESVLRTTQFAELPAEHKTAEDLQIAQHELKILGPLQRYGSKNVVILLDLMFPLDQNPRDGIAFIRSIRAGEREVDSRTPVIVHSNVANRNIINEALEAGANMFFKKTDDPGALLDAISFFLGKEKLTNRTAWEVVQLYRDRGKMRIRATARDRYILERLIDLDMCPLEARIEGGSFLAETYKKYRDYEVEVLIKTKTVDVDKEREEIARILDIKVNL